MALDRSSAHPGAFEPEVIARFVRVFGPVTRAMWPASFHGLENLPEHDRFIVIANHSGMGMAELWALILGWYERAQPPGSPRRIAGMAHPSAFKVPPIAYFLRGLGAVEATAAGAAAARAAGAPLLLFPGGDKESIRPIWQARRVDFAGRKGWIRIARAHGLAIVPMCITGSHVTLPILGGGRAASWLLGTRLLGVHRAPITVLSLAAAAASIGLTRLLGARWWVSALTAWASMSVAMIVPWVPSAIGFHILPAIPAEALGEDEATADAIYAQVVGSLQATLCADRPAPRGASVESR